MRKKKFLAVIAIATSVSLMAPSYVSYVPLNSVAIAETIGVELGASGSFPCENEETLEYTFVDGVLTISGKGNKLVQPRVFNNNATITKVVFTEDCALENMFYMFFGCKNLKTIENIPDTVIDMGYALSRTALTEIPQLPANVKTLDYAFSHCSGITKVDFSKLPSSIYSFDGAFSGTSVTEVKITFADMEKKEKSTMKFSYCFSECSLLKTMVIDCTNLTTEKKLWLQGICQGCTALESFELINIPENHKKPGSECSSAMFRNCENLVSVKNEGYFYYSGEEIFENCKKLKTIETKGFVEFFPRDGLAAAFKDCEMLEGTYYIQLTNGSQIYDGFYRDNQLEMVKENLKYTFKGCSDKVTFYVNCKPLVDYCNELKAQEEYKFDANVVYWEEGDTFKTSDSTTTEEPVITSTPEATVIPTESAIATETPDTESATPKPYATTIPVSTPKPAATPKPVTTITPTVVPITKTTVTKVTTSVSKKKKVVLSWKKKAGVTGYQIYKKTGSGKYKLAKTIKKASITKWTDKAVKKGKTYRYKIRAYKIVKKKKTYSKFSSVKKVKVK